MVELNRDIKVNLEYFKKKPIYIAFIVALISFIVCVIVAATAAPNILGGKTLDYNTCKSSADYFCFNYYHPENYAYFSVDLTPINQIFYLQLDFDSKADIDKEIKYDLFISYSYDFNSYLYLINNKTIRIKCTDGECDSELLFYMPYVSHENFNVDLRFYGLITADSMNFKIRYITKEFTQFFLIVKYFFLVISFLAIAHFFYHLRAIEFKKWSLESKLSGFMLLSLFVFNEPLLYLSLSKMTSEWTSFSIFCNFQFVGFMLLFWFQILKIDLSLKKKIITTIMEIVTVSAFIILMSEMYDSTIKEQKKNPTFSWEYDLPAEGKKYYIAGLALLIILGLMMIAHIVYSIIKVRPLIKIWEESTKRRRSMVCFTYFMILISFLFIGIGAFQPVPRSGTLLLVCVSFFNILFILLSLLFTPSRADYKDYLQKKKQEEERNLRSPGELNQDENNEHLHPYNPRAHDVQGITISLNQ